MPRCTEHRVYMYKWGDTQCKAHPMCLLFLWSPRNNDIDYHLFYMFVFFYGGVVIVWMVFVFASESPSVPQTERISMNPLKDHNNVTMTLVKQWTTRQETDLSTSGDRHRARGGCGYSCAVYVCLYDLWGSGNKNTQVSKAGALS